MAVIETWIKTDLKSIVKVTPIHGILFTQDNMANLIGVELLEGGQPATVTGSVSANVLRADGTTVAVSGTLSGNKASVTLPQAAYAVPGMLSVVIKLTDSSTVTTIGAIQAIVYRASTDTIIDPGTIIPSVQDLIAAIDAAVDSIPPDYSALTAEVGDLKNALTSSVQNIKVIKAPEKVNMLDSNTTIILNGKWWSYDNRAVEDKNGMSIAYIKVQPSTIYAYLANVNLYGSAASRLPTFDENLNYIEYKYGTLDSSTNIVDIRNFNATAVYVLYPFATADQSCFFALGEFAALPNFSYNLNNRIQITDDNAPDYLKKSVFSPISPIFEGYATKTKDQAGFDVYSGVDNTAGIQSTINKIVSNQKSGRVYIPNGIHQISTPIEINDKSIMIDGEVWNYPDHPNGVIPSKNGTVLRLSSYNICGINVISGNGLGIYNIGMNGANWDTSGLFDRSNPSNGCAIYQSGTYSDQIEFRRVNVNGLAVAFCASNSDTVSKQVDAASIHDCNMDGSGSGIIIDGVSCIYSKFYNNLIADTPCYGVFLSGTNRGVVIKGNTFVRNSGKFSASQKTAFTEGVYAVYMANATRCTIDQNTIHDAGCFYNVIDAQNPYYEYDTDACGLYIDGDQCVITGNSVYMAENHSAVINGSMHTITGNLFRDKTNGLVLGCSTSTFTGNKVLTGGEYSLTVSGNYNTIMANAIEQKVKVTGNSNCIVCSGRYETIEIAEGATGNLLIGYASSQIVDNGTGTIIR